MMLFVVFVVVVVGHSWRGVGGEGAAPPPSAFVKLDAALAFFQLSVRLLCLLLLLLRLLLLLLLLFLVVVVVLVVVVLVVVVVVVDVVDVVVVCPLCCCCLSSLLLLMLLFVVFVVVVVVVLVVGHSWRGVGGEGAAPPPHCVREAGRCTGVL